VGSSNNKLEGERAREEPPVVVDGGVGVGVHGANADPIAENLWIMNADGTQQTPMTTLTAEGVAMSVGQITGDGLTLVYQSNRAVDLTDATTVAGGHNVFRLNLATQSSLPLTTVDEDSVHNYFSDVSPDGKTVSFSARTPDGDEGFILNAGLIGIEGLNPVAITDSGAVGTACANGQFTPDGASLLYRCNLALDGSGQLHPQGARNLWRYDIAAGTSEPLTLLSATGVMSYAPTPLEDGALVYSSNRALDGSDAVGGPVNLWHQTTGEPPVPLTNYTVEGIFMSAQAIAHACVVAVCGDSEVDPVEQCDDGNDALEPCPYGATSCLVCATGCQKAFGATSFCGDDVVDAGNGEQCDDGNLEPDDGCSPTCTL